jgi:hypothetical protein
LQGIDNAEIIETVHARGAPMIPVSQHLRSSARHADIPQLRRQIGSAETRPRRSSLGEGCCHRPRVARGSGSRPDRRTVDDGEAAFCLGKRTVCGIPIPALEVQVQARQTREPITPPTQPRWGDPLTTDTTRVRR